VLVLLLGPGWGPENMGSGFQVVNDHFRELLATYGASRAAE